MWLEFSLTEIDGGRSKVNNFNTKTFCFSNVLSVPYIVGFELCRQEIFNLL